MTADQLYAIIGSNVVAVAVVSAVTGTFFQRTVARLDRRIENDKAAADANRRAFQRAMDDFRKEMQDARSEFRSEMERLAERQSPLEGARTASGDRPPH